MVLSACVGWRDMPVPNERVDGAGLLIYIEGLRAFGPRLRERIGVLCWQASSP